MEMEDMVAQRRLPSLLGKLALSKAEFRIE
jgi:hypothetical protein